ncbi:hypothetical protein [Photobacterium nomapromontoriensis]|uniref:hypothetical protein n=1 Tax=Photobacterium nomapromontoriensis TaxID=2910237 RepID=UPI003D0E4A01
MRISFFAATAMLMMPSAGVLAAAETVPVTFQAIPQIMTEFDTAAEYRKKAVTYGRLAHKVELGQLFPTYIAGSDGRPKLETENIVTDQVVIARNPEPVSGAVYNEWLVPKDKWQATYGEVPMFDTFMPFKRIKTIKAIPITDDVLTLLGSKNGETAVIAVDWNTKGMTVYKDGFLADGGYGIAPDEMQKTYELVD